MPLPQVDSLSLRHWDQDDPHELMGAHCFVPGEPRSWGGGLGGGRPCDVGPPARPPVCPPARLPVTGCYKASTFLLAASKVRQQAKKPAYSRYSHPHVKGVPAPCSLVPCRVQWPVGARAVSRPAHLLRQPRARDPQLLHRQGAAPHLHRQPAVSARRLAAPSAKPCLPRRCSDLWAGIPLGCLFTCTSRSGFVAALITLVSLHPTWAWPVQAWRCRPSGTALQQMLWW